MIENKWNCSECFRNLLMARKKRGQGLVGNRLKSFPPHYSLFKWHLDSCTRVVKHTVLIPQGIVGRAFCSEMQLNYFHASYHQLSRTLNILNHIEVDSHPGIMIIQRRIVGMSFSSHPETMSLKPLGVSCSPLTLGWVSIVQWCCSLACAIIS